MAKNSPSERNKLPGSKKSQITIHVLNFHGIHSHLEIVLENKSAELPTYYRINRWGPPKDRWTPKDDEIDKLPHIKSFFRPFYPHLIMEDASSIYSFDIEVDDPNELIRAWYNYFGETRDKAFIFSENCATAVQRFLTHFANIPKTNSSDPDNVSWNHFAFGIMWPSFIPCPMTLPGRVMDNVKFHIEKEKTRIRSIDGLPRYNKKSYKNSGAEVLRKISEMEVNNALAKFNDLDKFYDCLDDLKLHADNLKACGYYSAYQDATTLLKELNQNATDYLKTDGYSKVRYQNFKKSCMQSIQKAEPSLSEHRDWNYLLGNLALAVLGVGVFYVAAACINKATTGRFAFFSRTESMKKVGKVANQLSVMEEKFDAIESKSLSDCCAPSKKL